MSRTLSIWPAYPMLPQPGSTNMLVDWKRLADEMERENLIDRGGPDALRVLACVVRTFGETEIIAPGPA